MPEFHDTKRTKLLIISNDIVDKKMAGPGIRYLEMSRALSKDLEVTLAVPVGSALEVAEIKLAFYQLEQPETIRELVEGQDVLLVSSFILDKFPFLTRVPARLVIDLYDPFVLENLYFYQNQAPATQDLLNEQAVNISNHLLRAGDFFICGSERQRDFWLGALTANGRINPRNYSVDQDFRNLIEVVGIGFPDRMPIHRPILKVSIRQFQPIQELSCGRSIWNWLDRSHW
jgi:hypothetical protein